MPVPAGNYLLTLEQLIVSDDVRIAGGGQTGRIQAAMDVAVSGDIVSVAPGVDNESVSFRSNGVTLRSRTLHAATINDGGIEARKQPTREPVD